MTHKEFIALIRQPETVDAQYLSDLREMVELYPYFVPARLLLIKALQQSNSIHFVANLKLTALYCYSRRWLYYYIHPEKALSSQPYRPDRLAKSSGDYFDMINAIELGGGNTKQSLANLAKRLQSARALVVNVPSKPIVEAQLTKESTIITKDDTSYSENYVATITTHNIPENAYQKLISEKKFKEAIDILQQLNLNNSMPNLHFEDQIRFLEKVIKYSKK